ncbi:MAG: type II toxin-antitoxin system RelE/ParE family toxin [Faecalibacterium sp.]
MGAALASISGANSDERFLVCGSYMVFYRITRENIFIDRVLYGRRDYLRVLFDKTELPEQEGS